ncbi:predicted protein [Plenodomus lingam JN3]|uniref:Predicted protein n=2 Tax=Leptosphaeria maculans TaxID=5022 RepID=E5AD06_LEPMJ|nr:predicted protein [Plenodomus lingam JN3]CBY02358.1 predicted protein [Plenodomus lingam JN3]
MPKPTRIAIRIAVLMLVVLLARTIYHRCFPSSTLTEHESSLSSANPDEMDVVRSQVPSPQEIVRTLSLHIERIGF